MSKETDLLKIQIYADYCHSRYTVFASYFYSVIVTLGVSMLILFFQKTIDGFQYALSLIGIFLMFAGLIYSTNRDYHINLYKNDNLIAMVDNDEALPSIESIIKNKTLENSSNKNIVEIKEILKQLNVSINQIKEKMGITS